MNAVHFQSEGIPQIDRVVCNQLLKIMKVDNIIASCILSQKIANQPRKKKTRNGQKLPEFGRKIFRQEIAQFEIICLFWSPLYIRFEYAQIFIQNGHLQCPKWLHSNNQKRHIIPNWVISYLRIFLPNSDIFYRFQVLFISVN